MTISIINVARQSLKFSLIQILGTVISMAVSIYAAKILVPEEFGQYGFLGLWLTYAGLVSLGISSAGYREIPVLLGKGNVDEALRIQNISITPELLFSLLPFLVILVASFFYSDSVLKYGLIITCFSYLFTRLGNFWSQANFMRERFNTVAINNLIVAIATPVIIVISVYWLKVYALLMAPLIAAALAWLYFLKWGPINFRFEFSRSETARLFKAGIILQGVTIIFWAFRLIDRTVISAMLPLDQLGLYVYAIGFIMIVLQIPTAFTNVLQPILWREASKSDNILEGFKDARRITIYLALATAMLIPLAQLVFYLVVKVITTQYIDSIPLFYILSYNLYLASVGVIANLVLNSSMVNKQKITLMVYLAGLALSIAFDIVVIKLGYGVAGVAWVTIGAQGLATFAQYFFARRYMFKDLKDTFKFQLAIAFPLLIIILFYFFHQYLATVALNKWLFIGFSLLAQIVTWGAVIGIFYRNYLSAREIKIVIARIKEAVQSRKAAN